MRLESSNTTCDNLLGLLDGPQCDLPMSLAALTAPHFNKGSRKACPPAGAYLGDHGGELRTRCKLAQTVVSNPPRVDALLRTEEDCDPVVIARGHEDIADKCVVQGHKPGHLERRCSIEPLREVVASSVEGGIPMTG